jgi:acyl carrier protein
VRAVSAQEVRSLIIDHLRGAIIDAGSNPTALSDDFDLLTEGVLDSIGVVELFSTIEKRFGITLDLANLDPESLTIVGPLSKYVEEQTLRAASDARANGNGTTLNDSQRGNRAIPERAV